MSPGKMVWLLKLIELEFRFHSFKQAALTREEQESMWEGLEG